MKLIFRGSDHKERVIANPSTVKEAYAEMKKFCDERNFHIYYIRSHAHGKLRIYDVGSHTEFFHLEFPSEEEASAEELKDA